MNLPPAEAYLLLETDLSTHTCTQTKDEHNLILTFQIEFMGLALKRRNSTTSKDKKQTKPTELFTSKFNN